MILANIAKIQGSDKEKKNGGKGWEVCKWEKDDAKGGVRRDCIWAYIHWWINKTIRSKKWKKSLKKFILNISYFF